MSVYIPIEGRRSSELQNRSDISGSALTLNKDSLDSKQIIEKYGSFLKGGAIGFLSEDGFEINVYVGTKTSPIRIVLMDLTCPLTMPLSGGGSIAQFEKFINWLKSQGLGKTKEGD